MSTNIKKKRQRISKDSEHYVNNAQFLQAIKDHKEKIVIDGIVWAPAPSQNVLIGEKHVINDSLSRCAILRKETGDRVFYALSRRSAIHYPLFKSESCIENDY